MASKEYQIIFQFKAAMDASMGQFGKVDEGLKELQNRLEQLQGALADASNFKAYTQSVAEAEAQLKQLQEREREATANLEAATAARKAAEQAYDAHALRITELRAAIRDENAEYHANMLVLREAKASQSEIQEEKLRHQIAVQKLTQELGQEEAALKRTSQEKQNAVRAEKEAETAKRNSSAASKEAERVLAQEKARLEECAEALRKAGVDTKDLDKAIEKLNVELNKTNQEMQAAQAAQAHFDAIAEAIKRGADNLRAMNMVMSGMESVARPVWELITGSVDSAAALEKRVSAVKAVSGASAEEMETITRQIRETGATTIFTAEEAADAMEKMALAGWDAQQMISGLPGVVKLAAAAGEDLESMTSIVADGMNAFQLTGTKAATKFADVLAKAATSSNTNVGLIGESLSYVETTAGNLGYSIEDVSIALAAMANNALKGSVAGSSLNTTLTRMSGANTTAAGQMAAMGLSMYDAAGQAKPLLQFLEELRAGFREFGDDAQAAQIAAYKLAGQRGMRGLLAIVNQSDEQWEKLKEDILNFQGAADQISTDRLDNFSGRVQLLKDAFTDLKITIGDQVLPLASEGVDILTDLTGKTSELVEKSPNLTIWATGAAGAILGMSKAMGVASSAAQGLYFITKMLPAGINPLSFVGGTAAVTAALAAIAGLTLVAINQDRQSAGYQSNKAAKDFRENLEEEYASTADMQKSMAALAKQASTPLEIHAARITIDDTYREEISEYQDMLIEALERRKALADRLNAEAPGLVQMNKASGQYEIVENYMDIGAGLEEAPHSVSARDKETLEAENQTVTELTEKLHQLNAERVDYLQKLEETYREETALQSISLDRYVEMEGAIENLANAWAEVWTETYAAYSSVFSIFEQVEASEASLDDMMAGLESQSLYWQTWTENLNTLRTAAEEAGINLGNLWDDLASGGDTQSAAYIQELVDSLGDLENPDTSRLAELVDLYNEVAELRAAATDTFSEEDSEYLTALEQFDESMKAAIEETESYDEARAAMIQTIKGYTDTLASEGDAALRAVERLGEKMRTAIYPYVNDATGPTGSDVMDWITTIPGVDIHHAYAAGTDSATPGLAFVGENGPELMMMRGGERILNAEETRRLTEGKMPLIVSAADRENAKVTNFTVNVQVQGDATEKTVKDLKDYGKEMETVFRRLLREERVNAQRRAYA